MSVDEKALTLEADEMAQRVCAYTQMHNNNEVKKESSFLIVNEETKIRDLLTFSGNRSSWLTTTILTFSCDFARLYCFTLMYNSHRTNSCILRRQRVKSSFMTVQVTQAVYLPLYDAPPGIK